MIDVCWSVASVRRAANALQFAAGDRHVACASGIFSLRCMM